MALIFNPYAKGAGGFLANFKANALVENSTTAGIYFYPSTVSMPASCPAFTGAVPAGFILSYTGGNTMTNSVAMSGNSLVFNGAARSAVATAAGTISWFFVYGNNSQFLSDSISLSGGGGVAVLSVLAVTSGQSVTWSGFNLTLV